MNQPIRLNFIAFAKQDFKVSVYRRESTPEVFETERYNYYSLPDENGEWKRYEISNVAHAEFDEFELDVKVNHELVARRVHMYLWESCKDVAGFFAKASDNKRSRRLHFEVERHAKGRKCVWVEPYYLRSEQKWGILLGFQFLVNDELASSLGFIQDKEILIASGSLNSKGQSNPDFYLFKHSYLKGFIQQKLPEINKQFALGFTFELLPISSHRLSPKEYYFKANATAKSAFLGLSKWGPLENIPAGQKFRFIYLETDRDYAAMLLKGLRGQTHPTTFSGMSNLFAADFSNEVISGSPLKNFDEIDKEIRFIEDSGQNILPIIITNSRKNIEDDKLYYVLKNKFTNANIPCQIVTKDLVRNENSLRYSLSNIGLQIFAKSGGKPWKMKPASIDCLIIGIGQSYNIERAEDGNVIEKNITYSILTDSSGIFKDIQVLSEGIETDSSYWNKLVENITRIVVASGSKRVALHAPFRISKSKILEPVSKRIGEDVELSVLVINDNNEYFGFDYSNNGLIPFEGSFVKLSKFDYLVWFEGIQATNPKITKRFGNPLVVRFWYSNRPDLLEDFRYREILLQDCINLSGANWRGFKAKQLPVSIFYCQRIAEFISRFREYHLEHLEINNLKPWFL